jgi:hypothetical protein
MPEPPTDPTIPIDDPPHKTCSLVGPVALVVQALMALLVVASLLVKRWYEGRGERKRRSWRVWVADVGKQLIGQALVHGSNLLVSLRLLRFEVVFESLAGDVEEVLLDKRGVTHSARAVCSLRRRRSQVLRFRVSDKIVLGVDGMTKGRRGPFVKVRFFQDSGKLFLVVSMRCHNLIPTSTLSDNLLILLFPDLGPGSRQRRQQPMQPLLSQRPR